MFSILDCQSKKHLQEIFPRITQQLEEYGFCIIQMLETEESFLMEIVGLLGNVQHHIRADENGIVLVSTKPQSRDKLIDLSQYLGVSNGKHLLHTDGAYLQGLLQVGKTIKYIDPPQIVALQCVQPAVEGGISLVVDMQKVLSDILVSKPKIAQILSRPGCVSFVRDDQMARDVAIFEPLSHSRWRVRFRRDHTLVTRAWFKSYIQLLYSDYLSKSQYQQRIKLQEGQVLIMDNYRVLHGRDSFGDLGYPGKNRLLRRVWICNNNHNQSETLLNFAESTNSCRAFERYKAYKVIEKPGLKPTPSLQLGIHLPPHLQVVMSQETFNSAA